MKKLFALLLVIVMMANLSVTVFAAGNTIEYNSSNKTSELTVQYEVDPNFTVTIPANVTLDSDVTVSTSNVVVEYGKTVNVKLTGTSEANTFKLRTKEGAVIEYTVMQGENMVNVGDTVLSVTPESNTKSAQLRFVAPTDIIYAGTYTGTVTFTIVVE